MRHQSLDEISRYNSPAPTPSAMWYCDKCGKVGDAATHAHAEKQHAILSPTCDYSPAWVQTPVPPTSVPNNTPMKTSLNDYARECHEANKKWWVSIEDGVTPLERNKGELLMLMVSEIAETMEGERKNLMDDKLPHRRMAEVELVDALIRIFDYAGAFGYDLEGAYTEKMQYNAQREDHKHEARALAGGKKW